MITLIDSSYLRFLNRIRVMEASIGVKKLDALEKSLLDIVMMAFLNQAEILVGDLLILREFGTQSTLHGRVTNLNKLGYIKLVLHAIDKRKKKVIPTKLAINHYKNLSKLLAQSVYG